MFLLLALILFPLSTFSPYIALCSSYPPIAPQSAKAYLGFDLNTYPGDDALPILRRSFAFVGYWLSSPPGAKENTWIGKRALLHSQGFGFAALYTGPQSNSLKSPADAKQKGIADAKRAAAAAKREGFDVGSLIFLDIEEGGRLPPAYHAYLREWVDELARAGFRAGVYCSGMTVNEGAGVTINTADDIRNNLAPRTIAYWIFNDACPPALGCVLPQIPRHLPDPAYPTRRFGNSPNHLDAKSARRSAPPPISLMATATLRAITPMPGFSTSTRPAHPIPPGRPNKKGESRSSLLVINLFFYLYSDLPHPAIDIEFDARNIRSVR